METTSMGMVAESVSTGEGADTRRYPAIVAMVAVATLGYALAASVNAARLNDQFLVAPTLAQMATYALGLVTLAGVALAFDVGGAPIAARGGRVARHLRAAIRRRLRHGRSRSEIANVEVGLTISFCLTLTALALALASPKSLLAIVAVAAFALNAKAALALCRLVDFHPARAGLVGLVYGLAAGYLLT